MNYYCYLRKKNWIKKRNWKKNCYYYYWSLMTRNLNCLSYYWNSPTQ